MGSLKGLKNLFKNEGAGIPCTINNKEKNDSKKYETLEDFLNDTAFDFNEVVGFDLLAGDENMELSVFISSKTSETEVFTVKEIKALHGGEFGAMYSLKMHRHLTDLIENFNDIEEVQKDWVKESLDEYDKLIVDYLEVVNYTGDLSEYDPEDEELFDIYLYPVLPEGVLLWDTFENYDFN